MRQPKNEKLNIVTNFNEVVGENTQEHSTLATNS